MGSVAQIRIKQVSLFAFFFLFLFFPYLILLGVLPRGFEIDYAELRWAARNTFFQALGSTLLALALGLIMSFGIHQIPHLFRRRARRTGFLRRSIEALLLMPSFLPPLFTLVIFLSLIKPFPMGLLGLILVQGSIYGGLLAVQIQKLFVRELSNLSLVAWQMGASPWLFWHASVKKVWPGVAVLLMPVFLACWASFSIPLAIGGGRATTIEILIFEKLRLTADWSQALGVGFIQALILGVGSFFWLYLIRGSSQSDSQPMGSLTAPYLRSYWGSFCLITYLIFFLGGFAWSCLFGVSQIWELPGLVALAVKTLFVSLSVSIICGLFLSGLLLSTLLVHPQKLLRKILLTYTVPSAALLGLAFLYIPSREKIFILLEYSIALSLTFFAVIYRLGFSRLAETLDEQVQVAQQMGAQTWQIFSEILWPQAFSKAMQLGGISAIWCLGDFALAKILLPGEWTLAIVIEGLLASYRVEAASGMMIVLVLFSWILYGLFSALGTSRRGKKLLWQNY